MEIGILDIITEVSMTAMTRDVHLEVVLYLFTFIPQK